MKHKKQDRLIYKKELKPFLYKNGVQLQEYFIKNGVKKILARYTYKKYDY